MIHEATFETEMKTNAIEKLHSTTQEAIDVGNAFVSSSFLASPLLESKHTNNTVI